ncbi:MAG: outer membrane lipid asymmetry maintenance protein MlaD [Alphaproteobacteria bacterium]|nr:outer membrane lipid asymmetry maintenance protein MlaD [Alphaproteobacteria bacterium]
MEKGRTFETVVGVFVLIIAVCFFNYVYSKSSWKSIDGYVLKAKFDRADGLTEGTDVKISGVRVGKIDNIEVDPKTFFAVVTFHISEDIKVPTDSSANVASDGLFGGKYLSITPGGEEETLKNGEEIECTTGPVNLESLIGNFVMSKDDTKSAEASN